MIKPARFIQFIVTLSASILIVALFSSCQKKEEAKQSAAPEQSAQKLVSTDNLQVAYSAELKRSLWYDRFAKQAMKENLGDIAVLFKALSRSEKVHAESAAKLLKAKGIEPATPVIDSIAAGKAKQYLKLSLSNENLEQNVYAAAIAADTVLAKEKQYPEAVDWFKKVLEADARHGRLLKKAIEQETNFARLPYMMCPECGYIVGSDKMEECPVCKTKKDKFQKI